MKITLKTLHIRIHGKKNKEHFYKAYRKMSESEKDRIIDTKWHGITEGKNWDAPHFVWVLDVWYKPKQK